MYKKDLQDKIISARQLHSHQIPELSISDFQDLFFKRRHLHTPFLNYLSEEHPEKSFTYAEFFQIAEQTAQYLLDQGLKKGDRIATIAHNHWQTIVQYFAAWMIGITVVPVNLSEDDHRIAYILEHGEVKLAFILAPYSERIKRIIGESNISNAIQLEIYADETVWRGTTSIQTNTPDSETDALIVFTSGTTGNPKAVLLSQRNLLEDARAISEWHHINEHTKMMCVLPIHHVNGTVVTHITPAFVGGSVVLTQKFSVKTFFERIESEQVHIVSVVPTLLQYLNHEYQDKDYKRPNQLHHIICGAGPLTVEVAKNFENRFGIRVLHGYGLSETTCYSCFLPLDIQKEEHQKWMRDYGYPSIGVPIPANEMAIHDDKGEALKAGERGEIVIRGVNVMKEYYANEEANEKAFTFGWFRSGDEGFFLEDEQKRPFFFITGRLKELIIRGGVNLAPLEIDEVINQAPGVKAGISVGFENDWYGEEVGAYVQLHDGAEQNPETILTYCQKELPFSKAPKVVVFGDAIPVTSTGKYQRMKVAHLFKEWKSVQFKKTK
ncbi:long-chain fatty acid--CoA ligase [bacterium]|nr:MAG: long-chain fatty acid--CoA ligase [bacterium]